MSGATEDGVEYYRVAMTFTYQVAGQTYHGQYKTMVVAIQRKRCPYAIRELVRGSALRPLSTL